MGARPCRAPGLSAVGRAHPQVGCALHEQCFTTPAETRAARAGSTATLAWDFPPARESCPIAHGRIQPKATHPDNLISAYNLLQATSLLCFSFSALILLTLQAPSCPRQGGEAPQQTREQHSHPRSGARHRSIPEQPRRSLEGDRAAPRAAAKGGEDCTSPNLPAELLLLGELFTSRGRAALQGKVRPMLGMLCP